MDWLQTLLDNSSTPVLTAFLLGLLTALSPCPLATNIAAIGFIGKRRRKQETYFPERSALYVGTCSFIYPARSGTDYDSERRLQHVGYSEDYRNMGGTRSWSASACNRPVHALW